jgi:hypothetical protein
LNIDEIEKENEFSGFDRGASVAVIRKLILEIRKLQTYIKGCE